MNLEDVLLRDTRANQPAATDVAEGTLYYVTDESVTEQSRSGAWVDYSDGGSSGITQLTGDVTAGPGSGSQAATIANGVVSDAKLRDSSALSVIGRSANSVGDPADIAAANDGEILRRSGTSLGFGTIVSAGIADEAVTYAKMQHVSAASRLLGRGSSGGAGDVEEITLGSGLTMTGTSLAASGASGALVLLGEQVASASANLNFTSLITSTYDEYMLEFINVLPATDNVEIQLLGSQNNGSSYDSGANYNFAGMIYRSGVTSGVGGTGQTSARLSGGGTFSNTVSKGGFSGTFKIFNPLGTASHKIIMGQGNDPGADGNFYAFNMCCWYAVTNAMDAFRIQFNSGNITSGTIRLYGIAKT